MGKLVFKDGFGTNNGKQLSKPFTYNGKKYTKIKLLSGFGANDGKLITLQKVLGAPQEQPNNTYRINNGNTNRIGVYAYNNNWINALNTKDGSGIAYQIFAKTIATGSNVRVEAHFKWYLISLDWNTIGMVSAKISLGANNGAPDNRNTEYRNTHADLYFKKENNKFYFKITNVRNDSGGTTSFENGLVDNVWKEVPTGATNFMNNNNGYENIHLGLSQSNGSITFYAQSSKIDGQNWRGMCMYDIYNYLYE